MQPSIAFQGALGSIIGAGKDYMGPWSLEYPIVYGSYD